MELANSAYQDIAGNIKVKIENENCITCGRCISACKHESRYFFDDTKLFFLDLKNGLPISLIIAPAIRTNIPEYKRLITYFKQLGVNLVYDASLGADISVWAHVRHIEKNPGSRLITQPCPVIVSYCEMYQNDLLQFLSPIHSPIACTSIYMKEYIGVTDRIAAISPCIAKYNEYRDTGLADYNVTFEKLLEYLEEYGITLPDEETDFDHEESGMGAIYPIQGGLKENFDYFTGNKLYVLESEGFNVYSKLEQYAGSEEKILPDVFDVLNCEEGCNIGTASTRDKSVFDIDKTMNDIRKSANQESKKEHYKSVYKTYDDTLELSHFIREYKPAPVKVPVIADVNIEAAFLLLGKPTFEKKNIDCSACGSQTCYDMARRIALNVNIPINCMVKSMEDARTEHENYLETYNQLVDAVRIAQEASRAKTEFLASMSHEIRTPMNSIIGMSEILEHENLNESQAGYVSDIKSSAHSLLRIINDILDMSKIEAGKLELNPVDYNFKQLMDNTVSMFTHISGNEGLDFIYTTSGDIPEYIYGDDIRLRQIITNICGNAVKFTEKGHVKLSICTEDEQLIFKVEDTGIGIREEDLPKLFHAFEQLDKSKNRSIVGTGLGLTICKSLVDMMGGELFAESEYGHGTVFTVKLPLKIGDEKNVRMYDGIKVLQNISAPTARILVTDDNEFNLKVTGGLLKLMKITTETADSGFKAIELIEKNDYDIVFMDHMMPEMNGMETVKRIREMGGKHLDTNIIALTANAVKGAKEMFLAGGFDDFISKPIDINELRDIVKRYLPPEKIKIETIVENEQELLDKEAKLNIKLYKTFVKENKETYENLSALIASGDIKSAHRIAHTLKSTAGYLGKTELHKSALSLERALHDEPAENTQELLDRLKDELSAALFEFERFLEDIDDTEETEAVSISDDELSKLFLELEPLLVKGDLLAVEYVERLQGITGLSDLAELIDDYDFQGALDVLKKKM